MQTLEAIYNDRQLTFKLPPQKNHCKVLVTFLDEIDITDVKHETLPKVNINKLMKKTSVLDKWIGCLKNVDINHWKEDRLNYLMEKHK